MAGNAVAHLDGRMRTGDNNIFIGAFAERMEFRIGQLADDFRRRTDNQ